LFQPLSRSIFRRLIRLRSLDAMKADLENPGSRNGCPVQIENTTFTQCPPENLLAMSSARAHSSGNPVIQPPQSLGGALLEYPSAENHLLEPLSRTHPKTPVPSICRLFVVGGAEALGQALLAAYVPGPVRHYIGFEAISACQNAASPVACQLCLTRLCR